MLISLTEALSFAEAHDCAVAAVNTPFFEALLAAIDVGERSAAPMVLAFAQSHEKYVGIEEIGPAMVELAARSDAPFVIHVDHGEDIEYIRTGLDIGFTSAMIDGSLRPYDDNVELTRAVVDLAHSRGIDVEGEIGAMSGNENGDPSQGIADEALYTSPEEASDFVSKTGVDCLAASFGTVHGLYRREPRLDYPLISRLRRAAGVPLVMHGGSGLRPEQYRACIERGVRKINYYTYSAKAALDSVRELLGHEDTYVFSDIAARARIGVRDDLERFTRALAPWADAR